RPDGEAEGDRGVFGSARRRPQRRSGRFNPMGFGADARESIDGNSGIGVEPALRQEAGPTVACGAAGCTDVLRIVKQRIAESCGSAARTDERAGAGRAMVARCLIVAAGGMAGGTDVGATGSIHRSSAPRGRRSILAAPKR